MKKFFYIHMFLMTTSCFVGCMYNGTSSTVPSTVPYNNGSLIQFAGPYHGTTYNSAFVSGASYQAHNRKDRRAHGQRKQHVQKQAKKLTIDDEVVRISDRIDKRLGREDKGNCCFNFIDEIMYQIAKSKAMRIASQDTIIQTLQVIDKDIQETRNPTKTIQLLAEKNGFFHDLVDRLMWYRKNEGITGSTIDSFFDEDHMFPMFSDPLSCYIGKQVKERVLTTYTSFEREKVQAYFTQQEITVLDTSFCTYTRTKPEIHTIALRGHEYRIDEDSIMISHDHKYLKATDIADTTIIWDMLIGERCDDIIDESIVWLEKKVYENVGHGVGLSIVFQNKDQYHVSLCSGPSFIIACDKAKVPTLYLYKKPTLASFLCLYTFYKNIKNNTQLDALLHSDVVQKVLTGFPQKNLIRAIQKAKEENVAKQNNCLF